MGQALHGPALKQGGTAGGIGQEGQGAEGVGVRKARIGALERKCKGVCGVGMCEMQR
jgi:hypothetical protein